MPSSRREPKKDNELYRRVDEILHYIWDPIGVSGCPGARDEYHSYLPMVFGLLKNNESVDGIAHYLGQVTSLSMGLEINREHDLKVAHTLIDWRESLSE